MPVKGKLDEDAAVGVAAGDDGVADDPVAVAPLPVAAGVVVGLGGQVVVGDPDVVEVVLDELVEDEVEVDEVGAAVVVAAPGQAAAAATVNPYVAVSLSVPVATMVWKPRAASDGTVNVNVNTPAESAVA
jgi:hypothetical protein